MATPIKPTAEPVYSVNISVRVPMMTQTQKDELEHAIRLALAPYPQANLTVGTMPPRPER